MSINQTIKDRLIFFIKNLKIGQGAFEKRVGLSNGYVNNIRVSIQPDKLQKIALCFPDLNTGWLMTGEGEMLKDEQAPSTSTDVVSISAEAWEVIKKQADSLASKDRQVEALITLLKKDNAPKGSNAECADVG